MCGSMHCPECGSYNTIWANTYKDGTEEWYCADCGTSFICEENKRKNKKNKGKNKKENTEE